MGGRTFVHRRTGKVLLCPTRISLRTLCRQKQRVEPTQVHYPAQFYEKYRKEAEEYDKEFLKKYDEYLNATLIFVSSV